MFSNCFGGVFAKSKLLTANFTPVCLQTAWRTAPLTPEPSTLLVTSKSSSILEQRLVSSGVELLERLVLLPDLDAEVHSVEHEDVEAAFGNLASSV
mmetsp:Transcript_13273/g.37056  ORF Transcript_13273/g.37056 Transcript_13273/m.37056 type:complete len:96 (+) Transcript_13273:1148-1435(+)